MTSSFVIRQINLFSESDLSTYFNSANVGDCVDEKGLIVACGGDDALHEVAAVTRFPDDQPYPNFDEFDGCPGLFFYPTPETWELGDRTVLCVK